MIYRLNNININKEPFLYGFSDGYIDFKTGNGSSRTKLLKNIMKLTRKDDISIHEIEQVHGDKIAFLEDFHFDVVSGGYDGMFTATSGKVLCVRTADCIPVLFFDGINGITGALHCGWKGIYKDIILNAAGILRSRSLFDLSGVISIIGPSICRNCFEVKEDFMSKFTQKDKNSVSFMHQKYGKTYFDLKGFLKYQLVSSGFEAKNIYDMNKCTFEDKKFFSYRRDKTEKRQVSYILLV